MPYAKTQSGYSRSELDDIQARWNFRFPPDLVAFFLLRRQLIEGPGNFDWIKSDPRELQKRISAPFEGLLFDVEHNDLWLSEWGERPNESEARVSILTGLLDKAPRLIPLYGHRYLPQEPYEIDNPVFSIVQSDIIYYGVNLEDWISREKQGWSSRPWPRVKEIRFWSTFVNRN